MIPNASLNCQGNPQDLVKPEKVSMHVAWRYCPSVMLDLFAERIGRARESAHYIGMVRSCRSTKLEEICFRAGRGLP